MSDRQDQPTGQGQPSGYEEGGQAGQAGEEGQRDKAGKTRGGVRTPPPPQRAHTPLPLARPQPGTNRARHGAKRARQREGVSPRLRSSTPGQGARATHRPSRAHTQHRTPARTTAQKNDTTTANTHARRRTSRQEQVQAPQSPQRDSRRLDGGVCTRQ